jgi:peptidoglycan/LPS O-acetylase OafA/YrhL
MKPPRTFDSNMQPASETKSTSSNESSERWPKPAEDLLGENPQPGGDEVGVAALPRESASERWPALDGLRGVAILLVVASHSHVLPAMTGGMVGVTLFFVLSGFLITNLLMREVEDHGRIDLWAFYGKRGLRLLPALCAYMLGISAILFIWTDVPLLDTAWPPLLYLANYAQISGMDLFAHGHTWSLAVEEHFYLVWPLLIGLGVARKIRWLAVAVVALMGWRFVSAFINLEWTYMGTDTNAYALGLGALMASIYRIRGFSTPSGHTGILALAGLVALSLVSARDLAGLYDLGIWLPTVAALLAAIVVWVAVAGHGPSLLSSKTLAWFGLTSYALYLWHAPLLRLPGLADTRATRLVAVLIAIAVAYLSWSLVEGPIMRSRLRQRLSSRRPRATP